MARDPYKYFRLEARELLAQFSGVLLDLEKNGNTADQVRRLLRFAHTLKGAARVVKLTDIADRVHAVEDVLSSFRDAQHDVPRDLIDVMLKCVDEITALLPDAAAAEQPAAVVPTPSPSPAPASDAHFRTVRVDVAEMDALRDGIVEAHTVLNGMRSAPQAIDRAQHLATLLLAQFTHGGARGPKTMATERAQSLAEDLRKFLGGIKTSLDLSIDQMNRELAQLRESAEQLRLVSAGTLFPSVERLVRDLAREMGKQVHFETSGGNIHLDGYVLGAIQGALVQLLRNAVAHGIETDDERRRSGKPPAGRIQLAVSRRDNQVIFRCEDDGRGVDLDAVRRAAEQRGLLRDGTGPHGAEDVIRVLLKGGISTAESVTQASGRGVGLDVVRESIDRLGGTVTVRTVARKGTSFELAVPLSITSLDGLMVEAGGETVTIPMEAVATTLRIKAGDLSWTAHGASTSFEGKAIPFVSLSRALFGTRTPPRAAWSSVILAEGERRAAVGVDRLSGTARVVMRPLGSAAPVGRIVAGATLDTEGNPQLVLNPEALVASAHQGLGEETETAPARKPILIVDDSLTTRMLEQSILESAGYEVELATSGEEGMEAARRKSYALMLVDVEMPGMDGFTFVERTRADPMLHNVPVILVTSRNSPEDLQRGKEVRADGYVVKGEFDQTRLLAMIKPLVAR